MFHRSVKSLLLLFKKSARPLNLATLHFSLFKSPKKWISHLVSRILPFIQIENDAVHRNMVTNRFLQQFFSTTGPPLLCGGYTFPAIGVNGSFDNQFCEHCSLVPGGPLMRPDCTSWCWIDFRLKSTEICAVFHIEKSVQFMELTSRAWIDRLRRCVNQML